MRFLFVFCLLGCSDYRIHKSVSSSPLTEPAAAVDTGVMAADTGGTFQEDSTVEAPSVDEPPAQDTPNNEPPENSPDEKVYLHTGTELYSWDPDTGTLQIIGAFYRSDDGDVEAITDIAIDGSGLFYGVSYNTLYRIDGHTAEVWPISPIDFPLFGLTCTYEGRLIGGGDGLFEIDTETGAITTLVPAGTYETSGDLVGLPDGLLYWAVRDGDDLVVVDPSSGVTIARGEIGVEAIYGLGYADGSLYGFTEAGVVIEINPSNGQVVSSTSLPGTWWGATTNPSVW